MNGTLTRRDVLRGSLTAGFALAVEPVSAQTVTTDTAGLTAGAVQFKAADGTLVPAYRALPARPKGKLPVVLVVQEIFGVHEHIKDVCRRFAKKGYYAIAPELYFRQGDVSKLTDFRQIISDVVAKVPDAQVLSDLDAALAFAVGTGKVNPGRAAVTGFCWGGRIVWLYAAHNPKVKAGGAWYGRLTGGFAPGGKNPIDVASTLTVPVLGLYGGQDGGIPQTDVSAMRAQLAEGKSGSQIVVYPDAEHGFNADYRPSYNAVAAKDAFSKLLTWFKKNGA
jgi:carboxymethylenebutenolidase